MEITEISAPPFFLIFRDARAEVEDLCYWKHSSHTRWTSGLDCDSQMKFYYTGEYYFLYSKNQESVNGPWNEEEREFEGQSLP